MIEDVHVLTTVNLRLTIVEELGVTFRYTLDYVKEPSKELSFVTLLSHVYWIVDYSLRYICLCVRP